MSEPTKPIFGIELGDHAVEVWHDRVVYTGDLPRSPEALDLVMRGIDLMDKFNSTQVSSAAYAKFLCSEARK